MTAERSGDDADAAEIAKWMEEDFGQAVADGMSDAIEEDDEDKGSQDP